MSSLPENPLARIMAIFSGMPRRDTVYVEQAESIIRMNPIAPPMIVAKAIYELCPLRNKIGESTTGALLNSRAMVVPIFERSEVGFFAFHLLRWVTKYRIDKPEDRGTIQLVASQNNEAARATVRTGRDGREAGI